MRRTGLPLVRDVDPLNTALKNNHHAILAQKPRQPCCQRGAAGSLRDILFSIFYEAIMRLTGCQVERTGFETALIYQLQLAFLRMVNKVVRRMH